MTIQPSTLKLERALRQPVVALERSTELFYANELRGCSSISGLLEYT